LARECGIQVAEFNPTHANFPRDSECYAGADPREIMAEADLGLLLDVDVPFVPKTAPRAQQIRWLQIDVDPLKTNFPMWGFSSDFAAAGDCALALGQVLERVRAKADSAFRARVASRLTALAAFSSRRKSLLRQRLGPSAAGIPTPEQVCSSLIRHLRDEDILVNEAITNANSVLDYLPRRLPGTYFADGGGGLGFSGGVALGLKLAHPERRVVQVVGDGVYHFCNPDSLYATAQRYGLPILTVVLDNGGWKAVKGSVQRVYPQGASSRGNRYHSRLSDANRESVRDLHHVVEAFGGYAEQVSDSNTLDDAVDRCLQAVDNGRAAVLLVRIAAL
jgi:acetolactate synthase I/II/III large subunit